MSTGYIRPQSSRELWVAFIAVLLVSLVYFLSAILLDGLPPSSDLIGHGIGILGFVLMVMTEILYSWRKRSRRASWGRMSQWLNFHIITGIVGPYMVLLHSAFRFNGLAGVSMLLTVIIVLSGFIGRYIYTAVPRSADGIEIEASQLEAQIAVLQIELQSWTQRQPQAAANLADFLPALGAAGVSQSNGWTQRGFGEWRQRIRWRRERRKLEPGMRAQADELERLVLRTGTLRRQLASLAMARRSLALWHAVHIPIGMMLFSAAAIHIVAAFYYATLLR